MIVKPKKKQFIKKLIFALFVMLLSNTCLGKKKDKEEAETPIQDYYRAMNQYASNHISVALKDFERIEINYPTFLYYPEVKVMIVFLKYLDREYANSKQSADDFISLYPQSKYKPYIEYIKALCTYREITGISKAYENTIEANMQMIDVATRYPNTKYGSAALEKHIYLEDLISYNMYLIAQNYQRDKLYAPAIRKYLEIIRRAKERNSVNFLPVTYYRLSECYSDLGIEDLSKKYKDTFDEVMKNFQGEVSFNIEGVARYNSTTDILEKKKLKEEKALKKKAKKEKRKKKNSSI